MEKLIRHECVGTVFLSMEHLVLRNRLKNLIVTLSSHQSDGLEDGQRVTSSLPLYTFLHFKIHNKESGLHLEKYCQSLIGKASDTNNLLNIMYQFFHNHRYFHEK